jgi:hypothetical protein
VLLNDDLRAFTLSIADTTGKTASRTFDVSVAR